MTNQQGAPEALQPIHRFEVVDCIDSKHVPAVIPNASGPWVRYEDHAAALCRLNAYCQELESQVIRDCMTHVQNPAEIEHVAGDVSKNWAETNMSTQQPAPATQQAGEALSDDLRDRLVAISEAVADQDDRAAQAMLREILKAPQADSQPAPIDMVLHCPACGLQHIDAPDAWRPGSDPLWDNPPHRSHLCHGCGHIWRPADVPTNGMEAVKTRGKADSPIAASAQAGSVTAPAGGWKLGAPITEEMHVAACKVLHRASGLDGLPQRMLNAMLAAAPTPPAQAADSVLEDAARLLESQHTWLTNVAAANLVRSLAARKQGGA